MRRITLALVSTIAVLVLLFSYRTSTIGLAGASGGAPPGIVGPAVPGAVPGTGAAGTGAAGTSSPSGATSKPSGATSPPPVNSPATVNGTVVSNGFGPVQVQLKISGGKITDVTMLALPQDGRSQRINSYAVPQLRQEVLSAQSAHIDAVSGATATSEAYTTSLQAALDAAHLGGS
jgi:uncharacterized protein with FMN-binding domain